MAATATGDGGAITTYRLYVVSQDRQRVAFVEVECTGDAAALEVAGGMARDGVMVEAWSGTRFVGEVRPGSA